MLRNILFWVRVNFIFSSQYVSQKIKYAVVAFKYYILITIQQKLVVLTVVMDYLNVAYSLQCF